VPPRVHAIVTTRVGGVSAGPYDSMNLATHVGDDPAAVVANRQRLAGALGLPREPTWLEQVHGNAACVLPLATLHRADAAVTFSADEVCAVLVADCLPVFLASRAGDRVALAHAGWRGLAGGVIESTIAALECDARELVAWLGPSIGPQSFEVGDEVRAAFLARDEGAGHCFSSGAPGRWLADLPELARRRLSDAGVAEVTGCGLCTYADAGRFYSFRRDGVTGRMAALAWLD
jgi:polyphenol oxidase